MQAHVLLACGLLTVLLGGLLASSTTVVVARVLALMYPRQHPRRAELLAEINEVPCRERVGWLIGEAVACLRDGISSRVNSRRKGRLVNRLRKRHLVSRLLLRLSSLWMTVEFW